jgi:hypothetical protein
MKGTDIIIGKEYAATGKRDWAADSWGGNADRVTILDNDPWYDTRTTGSWYSGRTRETRTVTLGSGEKVTLPDNISGHRSQYSKKGVLARYETGYRAGSVAVVPHQQVVCEWDEYQEKMEENKARAAKARIAHEARRLENGRLRDEVEGIIKEKDIAGVDVTANYYGTLQVRMSIDTFKQLVGVE